MSGDFMVKLTVKRQSCDITEKILKSLSENPNQKKTIQDVSKESGVSWESTKRHLELLKKLNSVREIPEEGKTYYQMIGKVEQDTLFSIPISDEHRKIIEKTYRTIKDLCSENKKTLSKTLIQKIAVDYIETRYPDIPRGWYLYGEMLLLPFDPEKDYPERLDSSENVLVKRVCDEYFLCCETSHKIRKHQYEKKDKKLYITKERLYYKLAYDDYADSYKKNKIRELLNEFIVHIDRTVENSMLMALVEDYCSQVLGLLRHGTAKQMMEARPAILDAFNAVWNLVATNEFYNSLVKYYDKELLKDYFNEKMRTLQQMAVESLEDLSDHKPAILPDDEITNKMRELMLSTKDLSPEERKKRIKEIKSLVDQISSG
jgi:DNA-binding transcriptional ArsR family regulator